MTRRNSQVPRLPRTGFFARIASAALLATGLGFGAMTLPAEAQASPAMPGIAAPVAAPEVLPVQYYRQGPPPRHWRRGPPPRHWGPPPRARYYGPPPRWHRPPPPRWHRPYGY
jgi:hypothetical protein